MLRMRNLSFLVALLAGVAVLFVPLWHVFNAELGFGYTVYLCWQIEAQEAALLGIGLMRWQYVAIAMVLLYAYYGVRILWHRHALAEQRRLGRYNLFVVALGSVWVFHAIGYLSKVPHFEGILAGQYTPFALLPFVGFAANVVALYGVHRQQKKDYYAEWEV